MLAARVESLVLRLSLSSLPDKLEIGLLESLGDDVEVWLQLEVLLIEIFQGFQDLAVRLGYVFRLATVEARNECRLGLQLLRYFEILLLHLFVIGK